MTELDLTKALLDVMQRYPDLTIDGLGGDPDLEGGKRQVAMVEAAHNIA
jgi:hypothetical protein